MSQLLSKDLVALILSCFSNEFIFKLGLKNQTWMFFMQPGMQLSRT